MQTIGMAVTEFYNFGYINPQILTMGLAVGTIVVTHLLVIAGSQSDPCQPHGETNVLTGECWGAGGEGGGEGGGGGGNCFSCFSGKECTTFNSSADCLVDASRNSFLLWQVGATCLPWSVA
jgi:hypothetical protein